jgi:hypothetical protein
VFESIQFDGVTSAHMARVAEYLARNGVEGFGNHVGSVKGECFGADYEFDTATGVLSVTPTELPTALHNAPEDAALPAFRTLVQSVLQGSDVNPLRPDKYGVYDYVVPTIDNNSGGEMTFSTSSPTAGTIEMGQAKLSNGASYRAFEADSSKLSALGVGGTVTYMLPDGQTMLDITYFLNTIFTHTFTVGLRGQNADRFACPYYDVKPVLEGYTYLTPTVKVNAIP